MNDALAEASLIRVQALEVILSLLDTEVLATGSDAASEISRIRTRASILGIPSPIYVSKLLAEHLLNQGCNVDCLLPLFRAARDANSFVAHAFAERLFESSCSSSNIPRAQVSFEALIRLHEVFYH